MSTIYDILRRPIVTEKTNYLASNLHQYVFEVSDDANRTMVKDAVEKLVHWVYNGILNMEVPEILYFDNRLEAEKNHPNYFEQTIKIGSIVDIISPGGFLNNIGLRMHGFSGNFLYTIEKKIKKKLKETLGLGWSDRRLSTLYIYYPVLANIEFLEKANSNNNELITLIFNFFKAGIDYVYFYRKKVIVSRPPENIVKNSVGLRHNAFGYAISYFDGSGLYYINGRYIDAEIFENISKENFLALENEDDKAAVITIIKERMGNEGLMDFLGAKLIDEKAIKHSEDYTEVIRLYKTEEKYDRLQNRFGERNQTYCWSEFVCPSTGSTYLIDNSADFTDAIEAARFLRPTFVPQEIKYLWKEFAN